MDLFKLIVLIALIVVLAFLLLNPGQVVPATPLVQATTAAPTVAQPAPTQPAPTQPAPTATQPVPPRLTFPASGANLTDKNVTLKGTGQPGSRIQVLVNGAVVGETVVGADGTWTMSVDLGKPGNYVVTTQVVDATGKPVVTSEPLSVVLAAPTVAVAAPVLISPVSSDKLSAGPATFKGTGTPGSQIEILVDDKAVGKVVVGSDGAWSFQADLGQPGAHQVKVRVLDATGLPVAESAPVSVSVAAVVVKPVITSPTAGASLPSGQVALVGTGKADDEIEIVDGGQVVGTAKVGADGQWRFAYAPTAGQHELLARLKSDPTVASDPLRVTVAAAMVLPTTGQACSGPAGQIESGFYIVGACDTLTWIAESTGISLEALLAANPQIRNPDWIYPGQVIRLPR
jgi:large repetitive protein